MGSILLMLFLLLSGCAPFVEYEHYSDPFIPNDGVDLICGGGMVENKHVDVSLAMCQEFLRDTRRYSQRGGLVKVNVRVHG